jgi:EAL domain-containing protein (putative c-di-GMP-specific phosphodiesterase class I)
MQMIKHPFRDLGSLIQSRGGDECGEAGSKMSEVRVDSLRERLAGFNRVSRPLVSADLAAAIAADQLFLEYQPKLDWRLGRITSAEALVRWKHPTYGIIPPDQFIALAAETGLVRGLTDWVIATAAAQAVQWHADNLALEVAVNISARDIADPDLPDRVGQLCRNGAIDPAFLTLELMETGTMREAAQMMDVLNRLRLTGVNLSIDDFGTGSSSLVQLQKMPFSEVKIDLSFVTQMMNDAGCRVIVETLIDLARKLGLKSVAEGVEDDPVLKTLIELGCDRVQGYYISRPIDAGLMPAFVRDFESNMEDNRRLSDPQVREGAGWIGRDALDGPELTARPELSQL